MYKKLPHTPIMCYDRAQQFVGISPLSSGKDSPMGRLDRNVDGTPSCRAQPQIHIHRYVRVRRKKAARSFLPPETKEISHVLPNRSSISSGSIPGAPHRLGPLNESHGRSASCP